MFGLAGSLAHACKVIAGCASGQSMERADDGAESLPVGWGVLQDGDSTLDVVEAIGSGDRELASHLERDRVGRGGGRLCAEDGVEIGSESAGVERLGHDTGRAA